MSSKAMIQVDKLLGVGDYCFGTEGRGLFGGGPGQGGICGRGIAESWYSARRMGLCRK